MGETATQLPTFEQQLTRYYPILLASAGKYTIFGMTSEDLAHTAILHALRYRNAFRPEKDIGQWLSGILLNVVRQAYNQQSRYLAKTQALPGEPTADPGPEDLSEEVSRIIRVVNHLPAPLKEAFKLVYCDGLSQKEAAAQQCISPFGFNHRLRMAEKLVRDALAP